MMLCGGRNGNTEALMDCWHGAASAKGIEWQRCTFNLGLGQRSGFGLMVASGGTAVTIFGGRTQRLPTQADPRVFVAPPAWRTSDVRLMRQQWTFLVLVGKRLFAARGLPMEEWMRVLAFVLP